MPINGGLRVPHTKTPKKSAHAEILVVLFLTPRSDFGLRVSFCLFRFAKADPLFRMFLSIYISDRYLLSAGLPKPVVLRTSEITKF